MTTREQKVEALRHQAARLRDMAKNTAEVSLSRIRYGTGGNGLGAEELERIENDALRMIGMAEAIMRAAAEIREGA